MRVTNSRSLRYVAVPIWQQWTSKGEHSECNNLKYNYNNMKMYVGYTKEQHLNQPESASTFS